MSYTQQELAALKAAAAKGLKSVSYDGHTVSYASIAEMQQMIATMERALNPGRSRIAYPAFDRGT
jgi:hypothetical protein